MDAVTTLPIKNSISNQSDSTRLLCASVFLGSDGEVREKLRSHVLDRFHAVADNYRLDVRLLARVLDFFDQRNVRYLLWHGPVTVLCTLILAIWFATATEETQTGVVLIAIVVAILLAIPAYRRHMRNHFEYALQNFARDNFDARKAMETFKNKRGKLEAGVADTQDSPSVGVYGGFQPFVGAGGSLGDWSLLIDTRKGKEGEPPIKFTERELESSISAAFRHLPFPDLRLGERLFVHGSDAGLVDGLLPDRFARPAPGIAEETLARYRNSDSREARVYQFAQVAGWGDHVRISFFYRTTIKGPMLNIENHIRVLQPIRLDYRKIDDLTTPNAGKRIAQFAGYTVLAPIIGIVECFQLLGLGRAGAQARKLEKEQRNKIEEQARFNYGATLSLRESFAASIYDHFFEKSDREMYVQAIQKQLLDGIINFLDSRNIDTSDLREQRTYIINSGLIVHGGLQAGAVAVGQEAKASNKSANDFTPKRSAAGGGEA
jgi:hypothetical protein